MPGLHTTVMQGDINILIIGPTGAGKSTFINTAVGKEVAVVGHGLYSCTDRVAAFSVHHPRENDRRVVLLDTPGFDDADRSDTEVLGMIRDWHSDMGVSISGIIYLHEICQARAVMTKILLEKIYPFGPHQKVVLATTKWNQITDDIGTHREAELRKCGNNFCISRFLNTRQSAWDIIDAILGISPFPEFSTSMESPAFSHVGDLVSPLDSVLIPSPLLEISFEPPSKTVPDQAQPDPDATSSDSLFSSTPAQGLTETVPVEGTDSELSLTATALQQVVKNVVDPSLIPDLGSAASLALEIVKSVRTIPKSRSDLMVAAQNAGRVVIAISEHATAGHMVNQIPYALKTICRELKTFRSTLKQSLRRQLSRLENFVLEPDEEEVVLRCNERIQWAFHEFEVKLALVAIQLESVVNLQEPPSRSRVPPIVSSDGE